MTDQRLQQPNLIGITGATGFLGTHLMSLLEADPRISIRALTRQKKVSTTSNIEYVEGSIDDAEALQRLLAPGSTFINLTYSNASAPSEAVLAVERLIELCAQTGIKRFIHCSSAAVYGRQSGVVTEKSPCCPIDEYGRNKLAIDEALLKGVRGKFELVILRPTEIFGAGGKGLCSLMDSLQHQKTAINYLRSSLFRNRRTHYVPVGYVAQAFKFCHEYQGVFSADIFNVSMDEHELNNFASIERILMQALHVQPYPFPSLPVPRFFLETVLELLKRPVVDTQVIYAGQKLKELGFTEACDLEACLYRQALSYKARADSSGIQQ